jgi:hypothetical protein
MPCPNCARTFLPDRLDVHLRSCNKAYSKKKGSDQVDPSHLSQANSALTSPNLNNKSLKAGGESSECSMCGRTFGKNIME